MYRKEDSENLSVDRLFVRVVHLHRNRARKLYHSLGLHRGQPGILKLLWDNDGLKQKEIANYRNLQPATVTRMLQRMEKKGFIYREQDTEDMRVSRIYLADHGKEVKEELEKKIQQLEQETYANFSEEEMTLMRKFLLMMEENLHKVQDE
jgi:DNA-binding MarR family transcriptional regulator